MPTRDENDKITSDYFLGGKDADDFRQAIFKKIYEPAGFTLEDVRAFYPAELFTMALEQAVVGTNWELPRRTGTPETGYRYYPPASAHLPPGVDMSMAADLQKDLDLLLNNRTQQPGYWQRVPETGGGSFRFGNRSFIHVQRAPVDNMLEWIAGHLQGKEVKLQHVKSANFVPRMTAAAYYNDDARAAEFKQLLAQSMGIPTEALDKLSSDGNFIHIMRELINQANREIETHRGAKSEALKRIKWGVTSFSGLVLRDISGIEPYDTSVERRHVVNAALLIMPGIGNISSKISSFESGDGFLHNQNMHILNANEVAAIGHTVASYLPDVMKGLGVQVAQDVQHELNNPTQQPPKPADPSVLHAAEKDGLAITLRLLSVPAAQPREDEPASGATMQFTVLDVISNGETQTRRIELPPAADLDSIKGRINFIAANSSGLPALSVMDVIESDALLGALVPAQKGV